MLDTIDVTTLVANDDDLLEVGDLMKILKCSRASVNRYMHNEKLPYLKIGEKKNASLRFRRESIRKWLADREIIEPCNPANN